MPIIFQLLTTWRYNQDDCLVSRRNDFTTSCRFWSNKLMEPEYVTLDVMCQKRWDFTGKTNQERRQVYIKSIISPADCHENSGEKRYLSSLIRVLLGLGRSYWKLAHTRQYVWIVTNPHCVKSDFLLLMMNFNCFFFLAQTLCFPMESVLLILSHQSM